MQLKYFLAASAASLSIAVGLAAPAHAQEVTAATSVSFEAAASVIGDTDYAIETSKLATSQVISQAATAILAQANARTSTVLTLLK